MQPLDVAWPKNASEMKENTLDSPDGCQIRPEVLVTPTGQSNRVALVGLGAPHIDWGDGQLILPRKPEAFRAESRLDGWTMVRLIYRCFGTHDQGSGFKTAVRRVALLFS